MILIQAQLSLVLGVREVLAQNGVNKTIAHMFVIVCPLNLNKQLLIFAIWILQSPI